MDLMKSLKILEDDVKNYKLDGNSKINFYKIMKFLISLLQLLV